MMADRIDWADLAKGCINPNLPPNTIMIDAGNGSFTFIVLAEGEDRPVRVLRSIPSTIADMGID